MDIQQTCIYTKPSAEPKRKNHDNTNEYLRQYLTLLQERNQFKMRNSRPDIISHTIILPELCDHYAVHNHN